MSDLRIWKPGMVRETGTCPMGHPRIDPRHLAAEQRIRPRALAIDSEWWPDYVKEWGDTVLLQYDGMLHYRNDRQIADFIRMFGREPPREQNIILYVVLMVSKSDQAMLAREQWLRGNKAFHAWLYPAALSAMRVQAATPEDPTVRFSN